MKYIFDQNLIKQLKEGKIAINYGDSKMTDKLEKLNAVLTEAFFIGITSEGKYSFYSKGQFLWKSSNETTLPSIILNNFFFEPGDTLYSDADKYIFIGFTSTGIPVVELFGRVANVEFKDGSVIKLPLQIMERLSKLPPKIRITKRQIADKFGISVDSFEIVALP